MEANDCPPLSLTPSLSHPKKMSELMKQAGSLVRQSRDPHSPIWIEGSDYPAQYLVRKTRSMSSQCKGSPSVPPDKRRPQEDSLTSGKENLQGDSLVVHIPRVYLRPQKVTNTSSRKEASFSAHCGTSLNTTVTSFPSMTDIVRQNCMNVLDFYLPDEIFQSLKLGKLQAANRNKRGNIFGQIGSCQSRRKARKNMQQPLGCGTVGQNLPLEENDCSQAVVRPCLLVAEHSPDSLPATNVSPPCSIYGGTTTKVCTKNALFSRSVGDSLQISWLCLQDKTVPCVLPGDGSFEVCERGRNEASLVDLTCPQDNRRVPPISFLHGQGSSCASNSSKIKEVGHVVWEEDVVGAAVSLAGSPSRVRVSSDQRNLKFMFAIVDKLRNVSVYGLDSPRAGSIQLPALATIGSVALPTSCVNPRILLLNLGTECILAACHWSCCYCWYVPAKAEPNQVVLDSPHAFNQNKQEFCSRLEVCGWRISSDRHGSQVVICVARTGTCKFTTAVRCWLLCRKCTGGSWKSSGGRNLPLPEGYSPIASLSPVESHDSSSAQLLAIAGTELLLWDCKYHLLLQRVPLQCSHADCFESCLQIAGAFLEEGRIFAVLGHCDHVEQTVVVTRKDERWGWLITFSLSEKQQQDVDPPLHRPRTILSYIIPHTLEMPGHASAVHVAVAAHCRGSHHFVGSSDVGRTLHLWHLLHPLPWASVCTNSDESEILHSVCCSISDNDKGRASGASQERSLLFLFTKRSLCLYEISGSIPC